MTEERSTNLVDLLRVKAAEHPDFTIFTYLNDGESEEIPLTYHEFNERARRVAGHLQKLGLEGERVLLLFPQGLEYLIALFGCFNAKVIAVPAYPPRNNRTLVRLEAIIENCHATAILADQQGIDYIHKMKRDFSEFRMLAIEDLLAEASDYEEKQVDGQQIAYLQYTSGSTGHPKGVVIRHENVVHNIACQEEIFLPDTIFRKRFVTWAPMYHDMGLLSMLTAMQNETTCYFMSPVHFVQKPVRWLRAISNYQGNYSLGPNFAFDYCSDKIKQEELEGIDLSCWWAVTNGSEKVRLDTILRFYDKFKSVGFQFKVSCPAYGMAETTLIVSTIKASQPVRAINRLNTDEVIDIDTPDSIIENPQNYFVSAGELISSATVAIVDPNTLQPLPEGREGEIWVDNPGSIASGYWENEEATQTTFGQQLDSMPENIFIRTGDIGFMKEGHLYITGRLKDMIIIRGRNYYPQDIELAVQESHEALELHSGAAFATEGEHEEKLVIVQEINRAFVRTADTKELIDGIKKVVSQEFDIVPGRIILIKSLSLPKTSSGKIQRYLAREQMLEGKLRILEEWVAEAATPVSDIATTEEEVAINKATITKWLVRNIAEKTKMAPEEIDIHTKVRDYPLESIDAIFLADELSKWLGITVSPDSFWALPSIDALAGFLEKKYKSK